MRKPKEHFHKNLKAYYTPTGRIWHVEENKKVKKFSNIQEMVEAYPVLKEVPAISLSLEKKTQAKDAVRITRSNRDGNNRPVFSIPKSDSKTVACYYCGGAGSVLPGVDCPNCKGAGKITVTTRGL